MHALVSCEHVACFFCCRGCSPPPSEKSFGKRLLVSAVDDDGADAVGGTFHVYSAITHSVA
jgi:hypothetical protein